MCRSLPLNHRRCELVYECLSHKERKHQHFGLGIGWHRTCNSSLSGLRPIISLDAGEFGDHSGMVGSTAFQIARGRVPPSINRGAYTDSAPGKQLGFPPISARHLDQLCVRSDSLPVTSSLHHLCIAYHLYWTSCVPFLNASCSTASIRMYFYGYLVRKSTT